MIPILPNSIRRAVCQTSGCTCQNGGHRDRRPIGRLGPFLWTADVGPPDGDRYSYVMRPLRYSINVTLDGCCDHRAVFADEDLHRHAVENLNRADALLF